MLQPTPASDFSILKTLSADTLAEISRLLKQKRPRESVVEAAVPEEFLRALFINVRVLNGPDRSESLEDDLADIGDWFESNFPGLMEAPGFGQFMKLAERSMENYQLVPTEDPTTDVMMKSLLASVGNITSFSSQPALTGSSFTPTLRVFLFNDDRVLLDSTGDWDDWLQLVRNLLKSLDEQARSLSEYMEIGQVIEDNLSSQIDDIELHIASLRRFLCEHTVVPEGERERGKGAKKG